MSTDVGMLIAVTSVARRLSRNSRITTIAKTRPSPPSCSRTSIDCWMNGAWSNTGVNAPPAPSAERRSGSAVADLARHLHGVRLRQLRHGDRQRGLPVDERRPSWPGPSPPRPSRRRRCAAARVRAPPRSVPLLLRDARRAGAPRMSATVPSSVPISIDAGAAVLRDGAAGHEGAGRLQRARDDRGLQPVVGQRVLRRDRDPRARGAGEGRGADAVELLELRQHGVVHGGGQLGPGGVARHRQGDDRAGRRGCRRRPAGRRRRAGRSGGG